MHPTLFRVGSFSLHTYGVTMALGFLAAILLGLRLARRQGIPVHNLLDLFFWVLVCSLLGARLLFVLLNAGHYLQLCADGGGTTRTAGQVIFDCSRALHLWEGGFVYYGGFAASFGFSLWYSRRQGLSFTRLADFCLPLVALGHFFGRIGCFAAGCCYGKPTTSPLGVSFPSHSLAFQEMAQVGLGDLRALRTPPIHPTQLYEALAELCIFVTLLLFSLRKRYHGQLMVLYLVLYPTARAVLELFRGDRDRPFVLALPTPGLNRWLGLPPDSSSLLTFSQVLAPLAILAAVLLHLRLASPRAQAR